MRDEFDFEEAKAPSEAKGVVPAALAGAAVYEGLPIVADTMLGDVPHGLATLVMSGKPIDADFGTPITRMAEFTRSEVKAIQGFAASQGVKVPIVAAPPGLNSGYFYDRPRPLQNPIQRLMDHLADRPSAPGLDPHIGLSRSSVPHALHEIGHASPIAGSDALRRGLQGVAKTLGQGSTIGNLLRAAIAGNVLAPPGEDASSARRFMYEHAPALVGATMAPELLEEGRATLKALRGSRAYGPGVLRTLAELGPAFGTYVAGAAAPVLATIFAKRVVNALRRSQEGEGEKTAAPMAGAEVKAPGVLRTGATAAWRIGQNPPKPKTIGPSDIGREARERAPAKPPSKTSYYSDMLDTLYNPSRGARIATPG